MLLLHLLKSQKLGVQQLNPTILETERLYLRELNPEIMQHLFTACSDEEIATYLGLVTEEEILEEKEKFRQGYVTYFSSFKTFHLLNRQDGAVIGKCGFHTWVPTHRRAEIGYELYQDKYKGKGLMKEALGPVLAHGFEHMYLHRIEALIADYNIPSHKLLKHYGFKEEGRIRGHYVVNGINEDSLMLSLLLPEYEALKSSWQKPASQLEI